MVGGAWLAFACGSAQHSSPGASGGAGGAAGSGAGDAAPIALQDLCPVFTHDLCVYLMQCGGARYRDAAQCEGQLSCFGLPALTAAAASGAVVYDPTKVGACHDRFLQAPCTFGLFLTTPNIYDVLSYCPGTVTPQLQAGADCSEHGECSEGLYCNKGESYTCPGKCRAFAKLGEACSAGARCADGMTCQAAVCTPKVKAGDSCIDSCPWSVSCAEGQVCPGNIWCDKAAGKCTLGRLEGEQCGTTGSGTTKSRADCAINLWCDAVSLLEDAGTCRQRSPEGGPCGFGPDGCAKGLHCVGYQPFGETAKLGVCQGPGLDGSDCGAANDCAQGLACVSGHCQAPGSVGAECAADANCQTGLVCVDAKCARARYPGDSCDAGRCTYSRCVNGTCANYAKVGEACTTPDECLTGACVSGLCYDVSICRPPVP